MSHRSRLFWKIPYPRSYHRKLIHMILLQIPGNQVRKKERREKLLKEIFEYFTTSSYFARQADETNYVTDDIDIIHFGDARRETNY